MESMNNFELRADEPATYIQDIGLAEEIAYGEYPHTVMALEATKLGLEDEAARHRNLANEAGAIAGRSYIDGLSAQLEQSLNLASPEAILTPEEQEFRESLLEGFELSYGTYTSMIDAMNHTDERKNNKLEQATEAEAMEAIDALLTPGVLREAMRQMEEFTAHPIESGDMKSPEAGFDIILMQNDNLTAADESAVAQGIQAVLPAYNGTDFVHPPMHNEQTAHKANGADTKVTAALAPRHLNIQPAPEKADRGLGDTATESQRKAVLAQNETLKADGVELVTSGIDLEAMTHIAQLIADSAIDVASKGYDRNRFDATYYKDVLADSVDGYVPDVYVRDSGQLYRSDSHVVHDLPSRALVVPIT